MKKKSKNQKIKNFSKVQCFFADKKAFLGTFLHNTQTDTDRQTDRQNGRLIELHVAATKCGFQMTILPQNKHYCYIIYFS